MVSIDPACMKFDHTARFGVGEFVYPVAWAIILSAMVSASSLMWYPQALTSAMTFNA